MLKSYRWIVGVIFVLVSLFFVRDRFSLSKQAAQESLAFEVLGVEEREIVLSVLSILDHRHKFQEVADQLDSTLKRDLIPALVSDFDHVNHIELRDGHGIVFPKNFFNSDPLTQEASLTVFLGVLAKNPNFSGGSLAKASKAKN